MVGPNGFAQALAAVVKIEGVYSNDPRDRGNWTGGEVGRGICKGTKYGISAKAFPLLDIQAVTLPQAEKLYQWRYWDQIQGDALPYPIALLCFDQAVNQGVHAAIVTLQRSVHTTIDGWLGPETIKEANTLIVRDIVEEICARRAVAYAGDVGFEVNGLGWMRRLISIAAKALTEKD